LACKIIHVSKQDFDVIVGADGRLNTIPGFTHKKPKGYQLGIAITVNFVNKLTKEEVEERAGVAFINDQKFSWI
jgi:hypothetical protein